MFRSSRLADSVRESRGLFATACKGRLPAPLPVSSERPTKALAEAGALAVEVALSESNVLDVVPPTMTLAVLVPDNESRDDVTLACRTSNSVEFELLTKLPSEALLLAAICRLAVLVVVATPSVFDAEPPITMVLVAEPVS